MKIALAVVSIFVGVAVVWIGLATYFQPRGYCRDQSRYLSDQELVSAAIAYRARGIDGLAENPLAPEIANYVRVNPGCCVVKKDLRGFKTSAYQQLFGSNKWVQVLYLLRETAKSSAEPQHDAYDALILVDQCGGIVDLAGSPTTAGRMISARHANEEHRK